MDCQRLQRLLYGYVCGALSPKIAQEIRSHLKTCRECNEKHLFIREMLDSFRRNQAEESPKAKNTKTPQRFMLLRYLAMGILLVVFVAILGIGLLIARYRYERIFDRRIDPSSHGL